MKSWEEIQRESDEAEAAWRSQGGCWEEDTHKTPPPSRFLPVIDFAAWTGEAPARRSAWGEMLPLLQTTMLTGPGGVGKSLFEQMLCTCIALGVPFLGLETMQMNTLYVTCEDDPDELWRRQAAICAWLGIPIAALTGKLHLVSLCGETSTELAMFDATGRIALTDRWRELEATCEELDIRLYAFDNATDAMGGNLNDLHQVAAFVNLLTGLAIRRDGLAMILHHPNKAGDDWLGSVAWHNKVRSRLIIADSEIEGDDDARTIRNPKANYGPRGGTIAFRWFRGAFIRNEDLPVDYANEMAATIRASAENKRFLECLAKATEEKRAVSVAPSASNFAPRVFAKMTTGKGISDKGYAAAMERLLHLGTIANGQRVYQRDNRVWVTGIGLADVAPTPAPTPAPTDALQRTNPPANPQKTRTNLHALTPLDTTYQTGAALGPAAPDEEGDERGEDWFDQGRGL